MFFTKHGRLSLDESKDSLCDRMEIQIGEIITLKKKHPCGSFQWKVLRVGADFRLKCVGCEHQIMLTRKIVEKNIKKSLKS